MDWARFARFVDALGGVDATRARTIEANDSTEKKSVVVASRRWRRRGRDDGAIRSSDDDAGRRWVTAGGSD